MKEEPTDRPGREEVLLAEARTEQSIMTTLKEIEASEQEPTEPVLVPCPHCGSHHVKQAVEAHLCPLDPARPEGW